MLNVLEVAIYTVVLGVHSASLPVSFKCAADGVGGVNCTNGMAASEDGPLTIRFRNGIDATKGRNGQLAFSNGITSHFDALGWVKFSNGISVRRDSRGGFRLAIFREDQGKSLYDAEFYCHTTDPDVAQCDKTR